MKLSSCAKEPKDSVEASRMPSAQRAWMELSRLINDLSNTAWAALFASFFYFHIAAHTLHDLASKYKVLELWDIIF